MSKAISSLSYETMELRKKINIIENNLSKNNSYNILKNKSSNSAGKKYLISIGINNYKGEIHELAYAVNDAKKISEIFSKNDYKVTTLLDSAATKKNIQAEIVDKLGAITKNEDTVVLHFSGHGVIKKDANGSDMGFLCPFNATAENIYATCISMTQIQDWFRLIPAKNLIFIIDSCISGLAGTQNNYRYVKSLVRQSYIPDPPIKFAKLKSGNRIILTACRSTEQALESNTLKHGVFSYYIIQGMEGDADLNNDGEINVKELYYYISPKVARESSDFQHPQMFQWGDSELLLTTRKNVGR